MENRFIRAEDVAAELEVSKPYAYKIIRQLNEELRKKEERKDRLHQNYLRRKANGKQKEWEQKYNAKRKTEIEARKAAVRAENMAKGVYVPVGQMPKAEPRKASLPAGAAI